MSKKIKIVGKAARRIQVTGTALPRIGPSEFAFALGAESCDSEVPPSLDPIGLGTIGSELIKRLRSTGGRPALNDAEEICKVPLSAKDVAALEKIIQTIYQNTGTRPSLGQVASVILRAHFEQMGSRA
jgi:hypothetical protein